VPFIGSAPFQGPWCVHVRSSPLTRRCAWRAATGLIAQLAPPPFWRRFKRAAPPSTPADVSKQRCNWRLNRTTSSECFKVTLSEPPAPTSSRSSGQIPNPRACATTRKYRNPRGYLCRRDICQTSYGNVEPHRKNKTPVLGNAIPVLGVKPKRGLYFG